MPSLSEKQTALNIPVHLVYLAGLATLDDNLDSNISTAVSTCHTQSSSAIFADLQNLFNRCVLLQQQQQQQQQQHSSKPTTSSKNGNDDLDDDEEEDESILPPPRKQHQRFHLSPTLQPSTIADRERIRQDVIRKMKELQIQAETVGKSLELTDASNSCVRTTASGARTNNDKKKKQKKQQLKQQVSTDEPTTSTTKTSTTTRQTLQEVLQQIQVPQYVDDDNSTAEDWIQVGQEKKLIVTETIKKKNAIFTAPTTEKTAHNKNTEDPTKKMKPQDLPSETTTIPSSNKCTNNDQSTRFSTASNVFADESQMMTFTTAPSTANTSTASGKICSVTKNDSKVEAMEDSTTAVLCNNEAKNVEKKTTKTTRLSVQAVAFAPLPVVDTGTTVPSTTLPISLSSNTDNRQTDSSTVTTTAAATTTTPSSLEQRIKALEQQLVHKDQQLELQQQQYSQKLHRQRVQAEERLQALQLRLYISETKLKTYQDALEDHIHAVATNTCTATSSSGVSGGGISIISSPERLISSATSNNTACTTTTTTTKNTTISSVSTEKSPRNRPWVLSLSTAPTSSTAISTNDESNK